MIVFYVWFGIISFVLGTVMGSAMTCLGDRLAEGKSWVKGRSECDACHHELTGRDLIPVVSYLRNHGKCRYCGAKLSSKYLWTELLSGIVFLLIFLKEGMTDGTVIIQWGLCSALLALSITDLDCYIIPDRMIVFLILWWFVSLTMKAVNGTLDTHMVMDAVLGACIPSVCVLILSLIMDHVLKKESMGGGDIKLLFALGLYLGLAGSVLLLIVACIIGLIFVVILKQEKIPFGPSISLGAVFVILCGGPLITWYMGLLG